MLQNDNPNRIHGRIMENIITSAAHWYNFQSLLLVLSNLILLILYFHHSRQLQVRLNNQATELEQLRATSQTQREQIELLHSGYKPIPEQLANHKRIERVSDVGTACNNRCWTSLLAISAGDEDIALDLAGMLVSELPKIVRTLERMTSVDESEYDLFHQWQGLFQCCGLVSLAEQCSALSRSRNAVDPTSESLLIDELIYELRQLLVEAFQCVRTHQPSPNGAITECMRAS